MKKLMKLFVLVAAAAMALASCQKNEFDAPVKKEVHFTINAGIPETKTIITDNGDGTYTPSWKKGDEIGIFFTEPTEEVTKVEAIFSNTEEDGPVATFDGTASVNGEGTFYAFYPKSAFNKHYGDGTIRLDLSASQKPTPTSFDPACDILVAQPCEYLADGEEVAIDNLYFARLMSVLKINLLGDFAKDEIVESISLSVAGVDITGNAVIDYKTATITKWNNGSVDRNVVTATYSAENHITIAGENNAAYFVVAPVTIPVDTELTFTIKTNNYNISKTVAAKVDMQFPAGNVAVINLTIEEENCEAVDTSIDYSGDWLIAGKEGETWYAAQKYVSGNFLSVTALEFEGESILESDGLSDCFMHFEKVIGGEYDGMYTITDAGGKYLSASSSNSNNMKANSDLSENSYWNIEANDDGETYSIVATMSSYTRNSMRFNYNSGTNPRVSCYDGSKTGQPYLKLFDKSLVKADTTPKIIVEEAEKSINAEGGELTFNYTLKNLEGQDVTVTEDSDYLAATASNGTVVVTVDENNGEARTATITLTCGTASVELTVIQSEPSTGEGAVVEFAITSADAVTKEGVTITMSQAAGSNAPAWYSTGLRLYAKNTIVVESSSTITKIEYVFTKQGSKAYASASGDDTYTSGGTSTSSSNEVTDVWTGTSNKVTVTLGSSGQRVFKSVKVYTE